MYTDSIQVIKHSWNIYVLLSNRVTLQRELVIDGRNIYVLLRNRWVDQSRISNVKTCASFDAHCNTIERP
jgi:hypothetical protein